jgi:hypothetical protein
MARGPRATTFAEGPRILQRNFSKSNNLFGGNSETDDIVGGKSKKSSDRVYHELSTLLI